MNKIVFVFACLNLFLFTLPLSAQNEEARPPKRFFGFRSLKDTATNEKKGTFILPLIYYTPDIRWAGGVAGIYYFKLPAKKASEKETRVSNIQFLTDYTQNKQLDVWGQWNIFTRNEDYLLKGEFRYRDFPDRFYGIGNNSNINQVEKYEYSLLSFKSLFLKQVKPALFLGFDYHLEKQFGFKYTPQASLESGQIAGSRGGVQSAVGLVSLYDNRDNVINAYKGNLFELSSYFYLPAIGSTYRFTYINSLYQKYWQIKPKHIIALQARGRYGFGEVPFLDLSTLGNDDLLRGYPKNRFRDINFIGSQLEYRFPLFWRLGMVAFVGAGDVYRNTSDLSFQNIKYSLGTGIRFAVNPAERLNLRLDYGLGKDGGFFYFIVGESF